MWPDILEIGLRLAEAGVNPKIIFTGCDIVSAELA